MMAFFQCLPFLMQVFQTVATVEGTPGLSSGQKKLQEAQQILTASLQLPIYNKLKVTPEKLTEVINAMVTILNLFVK